MKNDEPEARDGTRDVDMVKKQERGGSGKAGEYNRSLNDKISTFGRFETFSCVIALAVGVVLTVVPRDFPVNVSYMICALLAIYGLCVIFRMNRKRFENTNVFAGTAIIIASVILAIKANVMLLLLTLIGSILMFTTAVYKAGMLTSHKKHWCVIVCSMIVTVTLGLMLIFCPSDSEKIYIIRFLGILLMIESAMDIMLLCDLHFGFLPVSYIRFTADDKGRDTKGALLRIAVRALIIVIFAAAAFFVFRYTAQTYDFSLTPDISAAQTSQL
ncbi:MAG: hypothetical protein WCQ72_04090 [Eubacteriales bacterium]